MIHFGEQNGPFCDAKRAILKNASVFARVLFGLFTVLLPFCPKFCAFFLNVFYGNFC